MKSLFSLTEFFAYVNVTFHFASPWIRYYQEYPVLSALLWVFHSSRTWTSHCLYISHGRVATSHACYLENVKPDQDPSPCRWDYLERNSPKIQHTRNETSHLSFRRYFGSHLISFKLILLAIETSSRSSSLFANWRVLSGTGGSTGPAVAPRQSVI